MSETLNIPVERQVPLPDPSTGTKYPWAEMQVGDSFFVPDRRSPNMSSTAGAAGRRLGRRFTVRAVQEKGRRGVRVWRLE